MFAGLVIFLLIGYPVAFSLAAVGLAFALFGIETEPARFELPQHDPAPAVRHHVERSPAGDPVLHLHGRHPRALAACRGHARGLRPAVRAGARRPCLCGDAGRRHPRRDHRHGGRLGDRHGADRAAGDDALRLRHAARHRRHRRLGHHHPADTAGAGADRARRPARAVGRRHVSRRDRPQRSCRSRCSASISWSLSLSAADGDAGAAARGAHAAAAGRSPGSWCAAWCRRSPSSSWCSARS